VRVSDWFQRVHEAFRLVLEMDGYLSRVFLLPDTFQTDGVVFAFAAYYRNSNPIRFQLWRPVEVADSGDFRSAETNVRLLREFTVTPTVQHSHEAVRVCSTVVLYSAEIRYEFAHRAKQQIFARCMCTETKSRFLARYSICNA